MLGLGSLVLAALSQPCTITVSGLPVPARAHHHLELDGGHVRLDGGALELRLEVEEVVVRLVGPRYTGGLRVRLADCVDGRVLTLQARARPATLRWRNPPADLVVRCVEDCVQGLLDAWTLADALPPIAVGHGRAVTLELRAPGYAPQRERITLQPGDNELPIALRRRP